MKQHKWNTPNEKPIGNTIVKTHKGKHKQTRQRHADNGNNQREKQPIENTAGKHKWAQQMEQTPETSTMENTSDKNKAATRNCFINC